MKVRVQFWGQVAFKMLCDTSGGVQSAGGYSLSEQLELFEVETEI